MNPRDFDEIYEVPSRETMSWLNAGLGLSSFEYTGEPSPMGANKRKVKLAHLPRFII